MKTLSAPPASPVAGLFESAFALDLANGAAVYVLAVLALAAAARWLATF